MQETAEIHFLLMAAIILVDYSSFDAEGPIFQIFTTLIKNLAYLIVTIFNLKYAQSFGERIFKTFDQKVEFFNNEL